MSNQKFSGYLIKTYINYYKKRGKRLLDDKKINEHLFLLVHFLTIYKI